jgi:hypothetical protein
MIRPLISFYPCGFIDEWATTVSLAGVLSALRQTSADHGVGDFGSTVGCTAIVVRHNRDGNLLQVAGQR